MIQEFKVENYLSFRGEVTLSFEATKEDYIGRQHVVEVSEGVRLLRMAVIYGANASGKSNLLQGLERLRQFWFERKIDMDEPTGFIPFLLDKDTPNKPTKFELKFWAEEKKFWYQLEVDRKHVLSEKLFYYKTTQPTMLFTRLLSDGQSVLKFNPQAVRASNSVVEEITLRCLPNMSFFAARNRVNCTLPLIDIAGNWMKNGMMQIILPKTALFQYAGNKMYESEDLKKFILGFMLRADSNITGISVEKEDVPMPDFIRNTISENKDLPAATKEKMLEENTISRMRAMFEHTVENERGLEKYPLPLQLESDGTQRVLGLEAALYKAMNNNRFIAIDEMESSLHPDLLELVIKEFLQTKGQSQLVFTTHYDPLLNSVDDELMRKDSVWFTEKDKSGSTKLYPLTEFKRLNKIRSFQRSYRSGLFGAIPKIEK
jgi:AAA15 family ATPase/GTPase